MRSPNFKKRSTRRIFGYSLACCLGVAGAASAQSDGVTNLPSESPVTPIAAAVDAGQPAAAPAAVTVAPMSLDACIATALAQQPAIRAAQASLAAAESSKAGVDSIRFAAILSPDIPIRRKQACLGVSIAAAGLQHAEWEARYAVTRTFYSVQYARVQLGVIDNVIEKLSLSLDKARKLVEIGDPTFKVTKIDVDTINLNLEFAKAKRAEASTGILKAIAGLREAMGVGLEFPLEVPVEPLPALVSIPDKAQLISHALTNRGEMAMAAAASEVTALEIQAQKRMWFRPQVKTFAAGADIHAKQIPQGVANGEYRPGALPPEMSAYMVGMRHHRTDRAAHLNDRAGAVVEKTENLITLEVEATYLKWQEAADKIKNLAHTPDMGARIGKSVKDRFDTGSVSGEELLRARTLEDLAQSQYNEALFNHVLALAALERVSAGGFRFPSLPAPTVVAAPK